MKARLLLCGAWALGVVIIWAAVTTSYRERVALAASGIQFQTIRTNLACIYVAGTVQHGLAIAAVAHEGKACE